MSSQQPDSNPLLGDALPIPFGAVRAEHVEPAIRAVLQEANDALATIGASEPPYSYENTLGALDRFGSRMERVTHVVAHLNGVRQSAELRDAWSGILPDLAAFEARSKADPAVYRVLKAYAETEEAKQLPSERARHLTLTLDEMRRAGAGLSDQERARVEEIQRELASLQNTFQNNVLDGTNAYHLDISDEARLAGIPESALRRAKATAEAAGAEGWRFTLQPPSYLAVAQHAEDRDLRRTLHEAMQARGTGEGRDNRELIPQILKYRRELANLLGYANWADIQTEPRMAGSGAQAQAFERDLWARVEPHLRDEVADLETFAKDKFGLDRVEAWDVAFLIERLRKERYDLDDEMLRPYFAMNRVQQGMFDLATALFGIQIEKVAPEGVWHEEVEMYEVRSDDGTLIGIFYTDWYPRDDKRGGAWMMPLVSGGPTAEGFEPHVGAIQGNLTPPDGDQPALLTHREVETLFHEFGHLIHHLLSEAEIRSLSGTSVPWDFVELPSQIMENWLWEDEALSRIARHVEDGSEIPESVRTRMYEARTFNSAYLMARQISFGTVDLALHIDHDPSNGEDALAFGHEILRPFQFRSDMVSEGFLPAFSHIFAGGYAAGYYSYLWSEMLDADAFTRFREGGLYSREIGEAYRSEILSRGNTRPPEEMVRAFLGRDPNPAAMLARNLEPERGA